MTNDSIFAVSCMCGETYISEARHAGASILCSKCGRFVPISAPSSAAKFSVTAETRNSPAQGGSKWKSFTARHRMGLGIGFVCLVLAVLSLGGLRLDAWQKGDSPTDVASRPAMPLPTPAPQPSAPPGFSYGNAGSFSSSYTVPKREPVSLANGTNIAPPQGPRGNKYLKIINETDYDAAIKLVEKSAEKTRRFFYVRAHSRFTVRGVAAEECLLRFSSGVDWDAENRRFQRDATYDEFENSLNFRRINYVVSLKPSLSGNAPVSPISEERFADK